MVDDPHNPRPEGLTARQEAFSQEFAVSRNLRSAYQAAYAAEGLSPYQYNKRAREVFDTPRVQARIKELIDAAAAPTITTITEVLQRLLLIATADPNELMSVKMGCCRFCHGDQHLYQWREREFTEACVRVERVNEQRARLGAKKGTFDEPFPDIGGGFDYDHTREPHPFCPECRGEGVHRVLVKDTDMLSPAGRALFAGVKQTATGLEIKTMDQTKALELVGKILGAFKDDSPKTLQVELKGMIAAVKTEATDPIQAQRMYQDMLAAK